MWTLPLFILSILLAQHPPRYSHMSSANPEQIEPSKSALDLQVRSFLEITMGSVCVLSVSDFCVVRSTCTGAVRFPTRGPRRGGAKHSFA